MSSDIWKAILATIIQYHYLVIIAIIIILSVTELPNKIIFSIFPHKLRIYYTLNFEDGSSLSNKLYYRIYGNYSNEDIVRYIWKLTPNHYLDILNDMTFNYEEVSFGF